MFSLDTDTPVPITVQSSGTVLCEPKNHSFTIKPV